MSVLTDLAEWQALIYHAKQLKSQQMTTLFKEDATRASRYSFTHQGLSVDYSNNVINDDTLLLLRRLADKLAVLESVKQQCLGSLANVTEGRAALHMSLRSPELISQRFYTAKITADIARCQQRMQDISRSVRDGLFNGKQIKHVINIGVGGSDLGPRLVVDALKKKSCPVSVDFISNLDPEAIHPILTKLEPANTLVIITSKSFTTYETLYNAKIVMQWLGAIGLMRCIAVTANAKNATQFGITAANILPMWDWVGGRFSLWSAVGLPIAIALGFDKFEQLLAGAASIDRNLVYSSMEGNIALTLALIDCWTINFMNVQTRAIIPYAEKLKMLPAYLQQLIMESNGKSVDVNGDAVDYHTGPIIWGGVGCNSQHAFHQHLMQGTQAVAVDFIKINRAEKLVMQPQQDALNCQLVGQSMALAQGQLGDSAHQRVNGNKPHTTFSLDCLNAFNLGALISLYEHRTVYNAVLWRINPFDQFGVELGKRLSRETASEQESLA